MGDVGSLLVRETVGFLVGALVYGVLWRLFKDLSQ